MIFPQLQQSVGGLFERINEAAANPVLGPGIGLLSGSPQPGLTIAAALRLARERRNANEAAFQRAALQQATDNAFRQRVLDVGLARHARRRPLAVDLSEFSDRELDALTEQISVFRARRFADAQLSAAQGDDGAGQDNKEDSSKGKLRLKSICYDDNEDGLLDGCITIQTGEEQELDEKDEQELRELEEQLKEMERRQEELRRNDNIRSTQQCQKDPNCRLA